MKENMFVSRYRYICLYLEFGYSVKVDDATIVIYVLIIQFMFDRM